MADCDEAARLQRLGPRSTPSRYERTLATTEGMLFLYQKYPKTEAVDLTTLTHH